MCASEQAWCVCLLECVGGRVCIEPSQKKGVDGVLKGHLVLGEGGKP